MRISLPGLIVPSRLLTLIRRLQRQWMTLTFGGMFVAVLSTGPVAVYGHEVFAAQHMKGKNIPAEVPMPMMQFPPLMSMHFPKASVLEVVPAKDFIDGSDLYRRNCSECHGIQTTSPLRGVKFDQISSAVAHQKPGMDKMQLKKEEFMAIIDALKPSPAS